MLADILSDIALNKIGVEIGGPSNTGDILYQNSTTIDIADVTIINSAQNIKFYEYSSHNIIKFTIKPIEKIDPKIKLNIKINGKIKRYNTKKGGTNCLKVVTSPCFLFTKTFQYPYWKNCLQSPS